MENQPVRTAKILPVLTRRARLALFIRKFYRRLARPWWAWEIFAAIISLAATMSLLIVLSQVDKQKQHSWTIGGTLLTINTIVAGIGTVLRTTLLLAVAGALNQSAWNWFASSTSRNKFGGRPIEDLEIFSDASANSWNCIKLLWRTKCRYLVTIGALVMILSLAFDAFLQQILSLEQQTQQIALIGSNLTTNNILPRSTAYNQSTIVTTDTYIDEQLVREIAGKYWLTKMTAALIEDDTSLPSANCPTGGCVWPVTPSLATCNDCKSVDPIVRQSSNASCGNITTYSIPDHPEYNITMSTCGNGTGATSWQMIAERPWNWSIDNQDPVNTTIAKLYSFGTPPAMTATPPSAVLQSPPWDFIAYECSISFCVKGFKGFLLDGSYYMSTIEDIGREAQYILDDSGQKLWKFVNVPTTLKVVESDPITVDPSFQWILYGAASMLFTVNITIDDLGYPYGTHSGGMSEVLYEYSGSLQNFTNMIDKVSDSITNNIRTTSYQELSSLYAPMTTVLVPTVVVQWIWLTYILALQLSGLLFLLLTMRATNRRNVRAWKGHRMALLLAELDPSLQRRAQGGLSHRTGLDDRIGEVNVRLEFDGDNKIVFRRAH